ncbi:FAS1 domain-containing protein [Massariosphaeria phaeospora]|uniref:FAS1 domain-containing protein n=1 Tax=Massariosphaeria phaeospora TaxID=100035 RepID=A0A7C8MB31_9PLEO|nr:FAS1 domain-containing protein [Massariosphaeria phaeospora]
MQYKHLAFFGLAGLAAAQDGSLNATLAGNAQLSNLTSFLGMNPAIMEALSSANDITILAPTDEAFAALLETPAGMALSADPGLLAAALTYHVLNGTFMADQITDTSAFVPTLLTNETYSNVTGGQVVQAVRKEDKVVFFSGLLQNSTVIQADVQFDGGVIHIVDIVLTLPASVLDTTAAAGLTALRGAVNATNLLEAVNAPDITIFAPNNEAFQNIGSALPSSTEDLSKILAYHVISGTVGYSSGLTSGASLQTANGANLTITIDDAGTVFVNSARVITADVLIANGVVHVIDNVLNPENASATPSASATAGAPAFSGTPVSDVPFTSGQPKPTAPMSPPSENTSAVASSGAPAEATGAAVKNGAVGLGALFGAGVAVFFV